MSFYRWLVFLHVVGVFGFLLAHGASALVGFKLRGERKRERIRALLDLSAATRTLMYWSLALLLAGGAWAGFVGRWWGRGWIWAALALLALIVVLVIGLGRGYFRRLRLAVQPLEDGEESPVSDEELAVLLASPRPRIISVAGIAILVLILYLMMAKPF
jgi:hypothetical protein